MDATFHHGANPSSRNSVLVSFVHLLVRAGAKSFAGQDSRAARRPMERCGESRAKLRTPAQASSLTTRLLDPGRSQLGLLHGQDVSGRTLNDLPHPKAQQFGLVVSSNHNPAELGGLHPISAACASVRMAALPC